jgi:hypothetical protein
MRQAYSEAIALSPDMTPYVHERAKSLQVVGRNQARPRLPPPPRGSRCSPH